jgi:hypothetical protein
MIQQEITYVKEKYVGSHCTHEERMANKTVKFKSKYEDAILYIDGITGNKKIVFNNSEYETSDKKEIEYIRKLPNFDNGNSGEFFEGDFSKWFVDEQKLRYKYVTRDKMLHLEGE